MEQVYKPLVSQGANPKDEVKQNVAKALAKAVADRDVRQFIKQEVIKQFDGDFDLFYAAKTDAKIGDETFGSVLQSRCQTKDNRGINVLENNNISNTVPLLNISMPELSGLSANDWNTENFVPKVIFVPSDFDERSHEYVTAYDQDGNTHQVSTKIEPDELYIVVSESERVDASGKLKKGFILNQNSQSVRVKKNNPPSVLRTNGYYEKIAWLLCPNLSTIESWVYGVPELRFVMVTVKDPELASEIGYNITDQILIPLSRRSVDNRWWNCEHNTGFKWDRPLYDNFYKIRWMEVDGGNTFGTTIGISGFTIGINMQSQDYNMGEMDILASDPNFITRSLGSLLDQELTAVQ